MKQENGKSKVVIFDFDGVISDSGRAAFEIFNEADSTFTWDKFIARFEGNVHLSEPPLNRKEFYKRFSPIAPHLEPFSGIKEAIVSLASRYVLTINSSGAGPRMEEFLRINDMTSYFSLVLGKEVSTSKVEKIEPTLQAHAAEASDCVMITDTLGDLREAHEAGVQTVAVTWGFHDEVTLQKGNPSLIATKPGQLSKLVDDLLR